MPIYEYVCQSCENRFEVKQKVNDPPIAACDRCGQPVVKVISAPAIMFKGSGWYVTDYSDKLKPPGQSESAGKPSNGKGGSTASEPKTKEAGATAGSTPAPAAPPSSTPANASSPSGGGGSPTGSGSSAAPSSTGTGS